MAGNWTTEEKNEIAIALHFLATVQKNYGRPIDVRDTIKAWEFVMASKYTATQVIAAMRTYLENSSDMPTPADLIKIISPPEPRITQDEYRNALEQHKAEGYPMFGYYGGIIKKYKEQQAGDSGVSPTYTEILQQRQNNANALQNVAKRLTNEQ